MIYKVSDEKAFAQDAANGRITQWSELLKIEKVTDYYDSQVAQGKRVVILAQQPSLYGSRNVMPLGNTDQAVAQGLFANLRKCETQCDLIIATYSSNTELAQSILNRLIKSAGQKIL